VVCSILKSLLKYGCGFPHHEIRVPCTYTHINESKPLFFFCTLSVTLTHFFGSNAPDVTSRSNCQKLPYSVNRLKCWNYPSRWWLTYTHYQGRIIRTCTSTHMNQILFLCLYLDGFIYFLVKEEDVPVLGSGLSCLISYSTHAWCNVSILHKPRKMFKYHLNIKEYAGVLYVYFACDACHYRIAFSVPQFWL
jgi:hypothetical protein